MLDVKVYIPLDGDLEGVVSECVTAEFTQSSLLVNIRGRSSPHRLWVDKLIHDVVPRHCRTKVTKKGKLIVVMQKVNKFDTWGRLRAW